MTPQEEWDDILLYLTDQQTWGLACARMEKLAGPWPKNLAQLEQTLDLACQRGANDFFLLYLLSRVLLAGKQAPAWLRNWVRGNHILTYVLPGLSFQRALSLNWMAVPVPTVSYDGRGEIFRMMMALRPDGGDVVMPNWARESLDSQCLDAVYRAWQGAKASGLGLDRRSGLYCWPMLDPRGPMIRGESLGLPLAMAISLLAQGQAWPTTLLATGSIGENGQVMPVGGLEAKVQAGAASGITLFLYPDDEKIDFTDWPVPALPVKDLAQAMTFTQLMALGLPETSNFRLYYACLHDADLLLDNFHQIPSPLLVWAKDHGLLAKLEERTRESEDFAYLVERLSDKALSLEHKEVLASLLSHERLESLAALSSQNALIASNCYRCLVELAEQKNDLALAEAWQRKASKLLRGFGNKIYVFYRTADHQRCYERFDADLDLALRALPPGPLQTMVRRAWQQKLIFMHLPIRRDDSVSARVFFSADNKVRALSLNALNLDIDPETGEFREGFNCILAVYLGLIRAAFVINREALLGNLRLHELLVGQLCAMINGALPEPLNDIALADRLTPVCRYYYARCFLGLDNAAAWIWPRRDASTSSSSGGGVSREQAPESTPPGGASLDDLSLAVYQNGIGDRQDWLKSQLLTRLEREALFSLSGVMDHFMGMCVIASYSDNSFFGRVSLPPAGGREIERILLPFLERIGFAPDSDHQAR